MVFGGFWAPFGRGLALSGPSVGRFWALLCGFFEPSKSSFCKALAQDGLQEAFGVEFGGVWGGIWEDLGGSWEDFGKFFGWILTDCGRILARVHEF